MTYVLDPQCEPCSTYLRRRSDVLADATAGLALERGIDSGELATRFVNAVHERHLAGLPLDRGAIVGAPWSIRKRTRATAGQIAALWALVNERAAAEGASA